MWWREREQEEPSLYNQILQIEARIAKLVAHQTRITSPVDARRVGELVAEMIRVQDDVETHLRVMRRQREEWVERYEGDRLMRSLGRTRESCKRNRLKKRTGNEWNRRWRLKSSNSVASRPRTAAETRGGVVMTSMINCIGVVLIIAGIGTFLYMMFSDVFDVFDGWFNPAVILSFLALGSGSVLF